MPIAVVDLETTGLHPGGDRIIEVAVVRVESNQQPTLLLDTLVNPRRHVSATEIHGITDADVADAPTFQEVAGNLLAAISGCVFASYNVYFVEVCAALARRTKAKTINARSETKA